MYLKVDYCNFFSRLFLYPMVYILLMIKMNITKTEV